MAPFDLMESYLKDTKMPVILPHHLFILAAIATKSETGLYPLTGMESTKAKKENRPQLNTSRPKSPEDVVNSSQGSEEEEQKETRLIIQMTCSVKHEEGAGQSLSLLVRFEDKMNRQLSCKVGDGETSLDLANELVHYGLVSEADRDKVANKIDEHLNGLPA